MKVLVGYFVLCITSSLLYLSDPFLSKMKADRVDILNIKNSFQIISGIFCSDLKVSKIILRFLIIKKEINVVITFLVFLLF